MCASAARSTDRMAPMRWSARLIVRSRRPSSSPAASSGSGMSSDRPGEGLAHQGHPMLEVAPRDEVARRVLGEPLLALGEQLVDLAAPTQ